jgi:hypothetical protein
MYRVAGSSRLLEKKFPEFNFIGEIEWEDPWQ